MKQMKMGSTNLGSSVISLGCMRISEMDHKNLENHIQGVMDLGINFFDHADIYGGGACEERFGHLLKQKPSLRDGMVLQSKCGIGKNMYDFSKEHILSAVDATLNRLQTENLDVLLLHRPDALMEPEDIAEAFAKLKSQGKVKYFGVSNFTPMQIALLQNSCEDKLIANQLQFSIMHTGLIDSGICANTTFDGSVDHDGGVLDYCRLHQITIQAWSPFQFGFFEGVFVDNDKFPELNLVLGNVAETHGVSKSTIAVAWILRHPAKMQVIAGTTKLSRLREIAAACEVKLSRSEWYEIYLAAGNKLP